MQIGAIGLAGMQQAEQRLNKTAAALAGPSDQVDLSSEVVTLLAAKKSFSVGAKLVSTEDEMSKTLVNLLG